MNVALTLRTIAHDTQARWIGFQPPHEIVADAMGLPRTDHVGKAKGATIKSEQMAIGGDKRLASQLTGAISRNGQTRAVVFAKGNRRVIPVDATARGVEDIPGPCFSHGLKHVLG